MWKTESQVSYAVWIALELMDIHFRIRWAIWMCDTCNVRGEYNIVLGTLLFTQITIEEAPHTIYDIFTVIKGRKLKKNAYSYSNPVTQYNHVSDAGETIFAFVLPNG